MNKLGWLVNDTLTCIPGTKTFWHDLLENVPRLVDKTGGHTNFNILSHKIEQNIREEGKPNYIIRNASFFGRINTDTPTISLLQDLGHGRMDVCNASKVVVFNSPYTKANYSNIQVLSVKSYIPECFDEYILKYKCTQKWVSIKNSEPKTK